MITVWPQDGRAVSMSTARTSTFVFSSECIQLWYTFSCIGKVRIGWPVHMGDVHFVMPAALPFVNYMSHITKTSSGENQNLTILPCTKLSWPHQPCCLTWLKIWGHQLCLKKMDPIAEQSPQSQGHCGLPLAAKHPGSGPYTPPPPPVPTWIHVTFFCSPSSKKVGVVENFLLSGFRTSQKQWIQSPTCRLHDYQNAFESWHRQLELCVRSGGVYVKGRWTL